MKSVLITALFVLTIAAFAGCGGAANTATNSNSAKSNSNAPANSSVASPSSVDTTPMEISAKDLGSKSEDEIKKLKGRTLVFKGEGFTGWNESSLTVKGISRSITCKGDFSSYKDAIKAFDPLKKVVLVDFKGVLDDVEYIDGTSWIKMKDCSIQKLD